MWPDLDLLTVEAEQEKLKKTTYDFIDTDLLVGNQVGEQKDAYEGKECKSNRKQQAKKGNIKNDEFEEKKRVLKE